MYLLLWDNVIGEQIDMHCVHTVSGAEMKFWIGPKGELDKELFACFGGWYYLSQAQSVRWDLFERTCVNNVWSCWLSVGIRVVLQLIWRLLRKNCRENSSSWNTNESAYCTNLLHFKDKKILKLCKNDIQQVRWFNEIQSI